MQQSRPVYEEKILKAKSGMSMLLLNLLIMLVSTVVLIAGIVQASAGRQFLLMVPLMIAGGIYLLIICWFGFAGLKTLRPGEAMVMTLFGKYEGTLKEAGFYWVNPFCTAVNPVVEAENGGVSVSGGGTETSASGEVKISIGKSKKLSLKSMTLDNNKQKINDLLGNPIIIGIAVIWRIENTAKAVFGVDNFPEFLSIQCDSALRDIVRLYPYDVSEQGDEKSLRGSSQEIAMKLKQEIQKRVESAGLEIMEARITNLAYAPEIAAVMLQRQQASAVVDARKMIVEGAVGMVEMALAQLNENQVVELDDERKAQIVSNLMVVLCGNRDVQPVVNSGSIY